MYPHYAEQYARAMANPEYGDIRFIRLTSPRAVIAFLAQSPA